MFNVDESNKSTRDKVLQTLLDRQKCTINELAEAVNINPISVRHHISRLEADALVTSSEEKHGVGRPRRVYYLTENGHELFPSRYVNLTLRLLKHLKESVPQPVINDLFHQIAAELASQYSTKKEGLSLEGRIGLLSQMLTNEGFKITWERNGNEFIIHETNCPYFYISKRHPEVCLVDRALISSVLEVPAEKVNCMVNGDIQCSYLVRIDTLEMENDG